MLFRSRPTTDRVKEALFSMIQPQIYGAMALDLFSGSGALGIELLSRGSTRVVFVEEHVKAKDIIVKNLKKTSLTEQSEVVASDVYRYLERYQGNLFDIIVMDPPYLKGHVRRCMDLIQMNNLLCEKGIIIVEHDISDDEVKNHANYYQMLKSKKYGKIGLTVFGRTP